MALPAPNLDDRKFQDIVDEAKRLIPRYCPEWTNHNLSDPGVALIELFAWMSEMVMYRLNQVPDRLYVKFLDLVGIEPFPPSVATTHLTFWLSTVLGHAVTVPAASEVATAELGHRRGRDLLHPRGPGDLPADPVRGEDRSGHRRPAVHRRLGQPALRGQRGHLLRLRAHHPGGRRLLRLRGEPGRRRPPAVDQGLHRRHRRRPAGSAHHLGGLERRAVALRPRPERHHRRPQPGRPDRPAHAPGHGAPLPRGHPGLLGAGPPPRRPARATPLPGVTPHRLALGGHPRRHGGRRARHGGGGRGARTQRRQPESVPRPHPLARPAASGR